jgi:hypothetical protein
MNYSQEKEHSMSMKTYAAAIVVSVVVLCTTVMPAAAYAATPVNDPGKVAQTLVIPDSPQSSSINLTPAKGNVSTNATSSGGSFRRSATKTISPAGTPGGLVCGFTTYVESLSAGTTYRIRGTSQGIWQGLTPYTANRIGLTDYLTASGVGISLSAGPVGVSYSGGGNSVTMSTSQANSFQQKHDFSGIQFSGALFSVSQTSTVSATFGATTYYQTTS